MRDMRAGPSLWAGHRLWTGCRLWAGRSTASKRRAARPGDLVWGWIGCTSLAASRPCVGAGWANRPPPRTCATAAGALRHRDAGSPVPPASRGSAPRPAPGQAGPCSSPPCAAPWRSGACRGHGNRPAATRRHLAARPGARAQAAARQKERAVLRRSHATAAAPPHGHGAASAGSSGGCADARLAVEFLGHAVHVDPRAMDHHDSHSWLERACLQPGRQGRTGRSIPVQPCVRWCGRCCRLLGAATDGVRLPYGSAKENGSAARASAGIGPGRCGAWTRSAPCPWDG